MANVVGRSSSSTHGSITVAVAEKLKEVSTNDRNTTALVTALVEQTLEKQDADIAIGYDNILKLENELRKIKPDHIFYDDGGAVIRSEWSKGQVEAKKKLEERIAKYDRALGSALGGDCKDLRELNNNFRDKSGGGKKGEGGVESETNS